MLGEEEREEIVGGRLETSSDATTVVEERPKETSQNRAQTRNIGKRVAV